MFVRTFYGLFSKQENRKYIKTYEMSYGRFSFNYSSWKYQIYIQGDSVLYVQILAVSFTSKNNNFSSHKHGSENS